MAALAAFVVVVSTVAIALAGMFSTQVTTWIYSMQRSLHRDLATALAAISEQGASAAWWLAVLSFLYGIFHAAGPGHGKVVLSTYLATHETHISRGILLSLLSSLLQGLMAVLLVEGTVRLFDMALREAHGAEATLEAVSYAMISLLGVVLLARSARHLWRSRRHVHLRPHRAHHHGSGDTHQASCCHEHVLPIDAQSAGPSWSHWAAVVLAVGIRPCSGAVLVLLGAYATGLHWAGIAAVISMSLGTAATVAALALISVHARRLSLQLVEIMPGGHARAETVLDVLGLVGGMAILAIGLSLLHFVLAAPRHPLF